MCVCVCVVFVCVCVRACMRGGWVGCWKGFIHGVSTSDFLIQLEVLFFMLATLLQCRFYLRVALGRRLFLKLGA